VGLLGSLIGGMYYGGLAAFRHYTLRYLFNHKGTLPFRLVPFLDYCAERIFLRKVGGGYIFIHRMLMEYFASLDSSAISQIVDQGAKQNPNLSAHE
jgi:hypothetical protein